MHELDAMAAGVALNPADREALLLQYQPFILKCACDCAKRYITKADDEWSIALSAFSEALDHYNQQEGSFLSFAKLVIHRRLYDFFDANLKYKKEISVTPSAFSADAQEDEPASAVLLQIKRALVCTPAATIADEIEAASLALHPYGFTFYDLTACSPKAEKTKLACQKAIVCLLQNPCEVSQMRKTRQLCIQWLQKNAGIPQKILERHRKYIIAVVELLLGDYPCLADYLRPIREELKP
ncbi:MAG: RNA polymerase subunit sigma [Clostridia bacterium]